MTPPAKERLAREAVDGGHRARGGTGLSAAFNISGSTWSGHSHGLACGQRVAENVDLTYPCAALVVDADGRSVGLGAVVLLVIFTAACTNEVPNSLVTEQSIAVTSRKAAGSLPMF